MLDDDKIFRVKKNFKKTGEARAVLSILGFDGVRDFASRTGINHDTAGVLLSEGMPRHKKHHYVLIAANEALHTAFIERRSELRPAARKYVCDWAKCWQKDALKNKLEIERVGSEKPSTVTMIKDRKRKRKKVMDGIRAAFNSLEWK